jgi:putative acetyltransferase
MLVAARAVAGIHQLAPRKRATFVSIRNRFTPLPLPAGLVAASGAVHRGRPGRLFRSTAGRLRALDRPAEFAENAYISRPRLEDSLRILPGDFEDARVLALLREHLDAMVCGSPPGTAYALGAAALQAPEIAFFVAWRGEELLGCAALKHLDEWSGEIKSMRTASAHLRKGTASRLLEHLLALARSRGYRRLLVETGSGPAFEPALALYRRYGFQPGEVFGDYRASAFNQFLRLDL